MMTGMVMQLLWLPSKPRTPNSDKIELHATNSACISDGWAFLFNGAEGDVCLAKWFKGV